jgi:addiction module HigA family antidote
MPLPVPTRVAPPHPGEILLEDFLKPCGITQMRFAKAAGISFVRLNQIVNGHRGITADTAMRFARVLQTDEQSWLNLQTIYDLFAAKHSPEAREIRKLSPLPEFAARG